MGQKVNPIGFRLGVIRDWKSKWFANERNYAALLEQDVKVRRHLKKALREALVDRIDIERSRNTMTVTIYAAKPGFIIGRAGAGIEKLKKDVSRQYLPPKTNLQINVQEIKQPNLHAAVIVEQIASDLERRIPFRRAMKQASGKIEREGALGYKIQVKGRLNGAEIARDEHLSYGLIPLHTLRADIDYARGVAQTTYGVIGIKVWIYKGQVFEEQKKEQETKKA